MQHTQHARLRAEFDATYPTAAQFVAGIHAQAQADRLASTRWIVTRSIMVCALVLIAIAATAILATW